MAGHRINDGARLPNIKIVEGNKHEIFYRYS